jgi:rod shape-determining protein MreD
MMSLQLGIPLFCAAVLLQAAVLSHMRVFGGQPDLIVVIVLAWSVLDRGLEGMVWAFFGGFILDLLSGAPLGISALALIPIAYVVGLTEAQVYRNNIGLPILMTVLGAAVYHILYLVLLRFFGGVALPWSSALIYVTLPSVMFDVILIVPALRLLDRLYARLHPRQIKI